MVSKQVEVYNRYQVTSSALDGFTTAMSLTTAQSSGSVEQAIGNGNQRNNRHMTTSSLMQLGEMTCPIVGQETFSVIDEEVMKISASAAKQSIVQMQT